MSISVLVLLGVFESWYLNSATLAAFKNRKSYHKNSGTKETSGHEKRVIRTDPFGVKVVFDSFRLAAKETNISPTSVSKCCNGKMISCRGFKF